METYITFNEKGAVTISFELWKALLKSARTTQKGRRGLSSRKIRVQKKIVSKELGLAILRGKHTNEKK